MSFTDDFNSCMSSSGLPTPSQVFDSLSDALEFLHQLHTAWEASGGDEEMTLAALAAAGAATGQPAAWWPGRAEHAGRDGTQTAARARSRL